MFQTADTIFALATGQSRGGIAVVRVSGPDAGSALRLLVGRVPRPRALSRARVFNRDGELLDDGMVVWFPAPASFTGEDVAELHLHGGRAVIAGVLAALGRCPGLRPAEAGEFSRRAFANEKLDLTAAEGLADLIEAETEAQRRQALRQMRGALGDLYEGWRQRLLGAVAHVEAAIDFSDEDIPDNLETGVRRTAAELAEAIGGHLADARRGERLRDGIEVAIVGPPNAGKSSLLNVLAGREAAIVSRHPGTTRDIIEIGLDLGGFPVVLADTAGLREADGDVEREGVERARRRAATADLKVVVLDGAHWPAVDAAAVGIVDAASILVVNKADLLVSPSAPIVSGHPALAVSALTGAGLDELVSALTVRVAARFDVSAAPSLTRERHRTALESCRAALARAEAAKNVELLAEDLRLAARELGRITGRVDVEQVLDVIFRDFCIGK